MPNKKEPVVKEPKDQTTLELIATIYDLTKEVEQLRQEKCWNKDTYRINGRLNKAAAHWNSITIQGYVNIINPGYNFYIHSGSIHYDVRIKEFDVKKNDLVMVSGRIPFHTAHDQQSRDDGAGGVDTITIYPDRIVIVADADQNIILPEIEDYEID